MILGFVLRQLTCTTTKFDLVSVIAVACGPFVIPMACSFSFDKYPLVSLFQVPTQVASFVVFFCGP